MQIDKFLVNRTLSPLVIKSSIDPYAHSDHDIISLSLDVTQQERGKGFWHFNNNLLADPIFTEEMTVFWTEWLNEKQHYANLSTLQPTLFDLSLQPVPLCWQVAQ